MKSILLSAAAALALSATCVYAQRPFEAMSSSTVTNAIGTISQLNYGPGGNVQGFLVGTNVLLTFPGNVSGGVSSLGAAGNSITYSGTALTASSGFETVRVSSFTNTTTKATYTAPTSTSASYGPTSGTVTQLNYSAGGGVDGFLFNASGSSAPVLVVIGPQRGNSTLASVLTAGANASVTGNSRASSVAGALTVVRATSLTISGQTFVFSGRGFGGGFNGSGRPGRGGQ
ncbi:MAG TPA: hypothetical protein VMG40_04105 [Bryobacteraceae bacterium]|nr:hypothetical protein [Bryobacteraceae bacterium]